MAAVRLQEAFVAALSIFLCAYAVSAMPMPVLCTHRYDGVGSSYFFDVYASGDGAPASPAVSMSLDACGNGYPTLYLCNPDETRKPCSAPFSPGPDMNTNFASTSEISGGL